MNREQRLLVFRKILENNLRSIAKFKISKLNNKTIPMIIISKKDNQKELPNCVIKECFLIAEVIVGVHVSLDFTRNEVMIT